MPHRVAIYPGSFDPPTFGHIDLAKRALRLFETVIVAVASNDTKDCMFSVDERMDMLRDVLRETPSIRVEAFKGLTVDFAREKGAVAVIRGLRAISDYEFELSMSITNKKLNPDVDTVLLTPSEPYLFLSSRIVKEVARHGGDISHFVPPEIQMRLKAKIEDS